VLLKIEKKLQSDRKNHTFGKREREPIITAKKTRNKKEKTQWRLLRNLWHRTGKWYCHSRIQKDFILQRTRKPPMCVFVASKVLFLCFFILTIVSSIPTLNNYTNFVLHRSKSTDGGFLRVFRICVFKQKTSHTQPKKAEAVTISDFRSTARKRAS
jgi:hypothetical protein